MKVANSMKVFRHDMLKGDDVHQWRFDTYQNLGVQKNYSLRDIRLLNAQFPTEQTVISTMMKEKENQGYQVVYMGFDSSTVCDIDVLGTISRLKRDLQNMYGEPIYLVFVDTYISLVENKYKLANIEKYKWVKPELLEKYVEFVESNSTGEYDGTYGIDFIYKVDFLTASKALVYEESIPIDPRSGVREKNEWNDNAQIGLLSQFKQSHGDLCVMLSNDKGLLWKCKQIGVLSCKMQVTKAQRKIVIWG